MGMITYVTSNTDVIHKSIDDYNTSNIFYYIFSMIAGLCLFILYIYEIIEKKLNIGMRFIFLFVIMILILLEYIINKMIHIQKQLIR